MVAIWTMASRDKDNSLIRTRVKFTTWEADSKWEWVWKASITVWKTEWVLSFLHRLLFICIFSTFIPPLSPIWLSRSILIYLNPSFFLSDSPFLCLIFFLLLLPFLHLYPSFSISSLLFLHFQIKQVFDAGNYNTSIGLGIREIFINLQQNGMQNINERAIRDACMEMTDDGVIYSTVDEDHFLATWTSTIENNQIAFYFIRDKETHQRVEQWNQS